MYAFTKSLRKAQHVRRYTIQTTSNGWEVKQEQDSEVVRQSCYQDWHRVERPPILRDRDDQPATGGLEGRLG
jgi:hypothetical protein